MYLFFAASSRFNEATPLLTWSLDTNDWGIDYTVAFQ